MNGKVHLEDLGMDGRIILKVKQSRYKPWRRLRGEEV
jgi:hypothetical protein